MLQLNMPWGSEGPYFEDFDIGVTYKHWPGCTISQQDNSLWSTLSMDFTPLYIDEEYALHTEYKRCIVNPRLVRAVVVGLCVKDTTRNAVANLGTDYEKLALPLFPGDSVHAESTVVSKRESNSRPYAGVVTWIHKGFRQNGDQIYESKRSNLSLQEEFVSLAENDSEVIFLGEIIRSGYAGKFWEDFQIGEMVRHRLGRTITLFDNLFFTLMGLNTASLHFDSEYAKRTEWGKPIIVASMVISIVCGLSSEDINMNIVKELDMKDVKMLAPVFDGDTIHSESEVIDVKSSGDREDAGLVTVKTIGYKDDWNTTICEFVRTILVYKRDYSPRMKMKGQALTS